MRKFTTYKSSVLIVSTLIIFIWLGYHLASPPLPTPKEPIILYSNQTQDDLHLLYNKAIRSAKKSIHFMIYSLKDLSVIKSLQDQSKLGCDVNVICDAKASGHVEKKLGTKVNTTRIQTRGIMHLKILVVDERCVLIGSANMSHAQLRMHGNLVCGVHCPNLAKMMINKSRQYTSNSLIKTLKPQNFQIGNQTLELWTLPDNPQGTSKIIELIQSAKKSLKVAMFTFTRQDFAQEIANKPFKAEVVIDNNSGKGVSRKVVQLLKKSDSLVNLAKKSPMFHHKFMWIDTKTLVLGSANWTQSAFSKNDDCFFILKPLTKKQIRKMTKLWQRIQHEI